MAALRTAGRVGSRGCTKIGRGCAHARLPYLTGVWLAVCVNPLTPPGTPDSGTLLPNSRWYGSRTRAETMVRNVIRKALNVNERSRCSLLGPRPVHMRRVYTRHTGIVPAILPRHRPPPARLACFPCSYWKAPRDWLDVPENPPVHGERTTTIGRPCWVERFHWSAQGQGAGLISQKQRRPLRSRCETAEPDRGPLRGAARWR